MDGRETAGRDRAGRDVADQALADVPTRRVDAPASSLTEPTVDDGDPGFRAAFESAPIGMAILTVDGRWLAANAALLAQLGVTAAALAALPLAALVGPDDSASGDPLAALRAGAGGYALERRYRRVDGAQRWLHVRVALARPPGAPARLIVQIEDVTTRHDEEDTRAALAIRAARSNRALQEFASVAAHDLQEPLRKIRAFGDRLQVRHGAALAGEGLDYLTRMQDAAARMQGLISDLLDLSRLTAVERPGAPVDLAAIVAAARLDLGEADATIDVAPLGTVWGDRAQLAQLAQNLLTNALKFRHPGRPAAVRVSWRAPVAPPPGAASGRSFGALTVADDGIGFEPQYAERIFGVFQRLHGRSEYAGTGVGLAICRAIAERHGGAIVARGAPGAGATFTVTLPLPAEDGAPDVVPGAPDVARDVTPDVTPDVAPHPAPPGGAP